MKSLMEYMKEVENKKRSLEDSVDRLNNEIRLLRANDQNMEKETEVNYLPAEFPDFSRVKRIAGSCLYCLNICSKLSLV